MESGIFPGPPGQTLGYCWLPRGRIDRLDQGVEITRGPCVGDFGPLATVFLKLNFPLDLEAYILPATVSLGRDVICNRYPA